MTSEKILFVTRGDSLTRIVIDGLREAPVPYRAACLLVSGDHKARTGVEMLRALWRASEYHYFTYELCQFTVLRLLGATDVASLARERDWPCLRVTDVMSAEAVRFAREFAPDLLVSVKCPQRIRDPMLSLASRGAVNVHASLLPKHAGRAPHFWALAAGEAETGSTVHYMTERFDAGRLLAQKTLRIEPGATAFAIIVALMRLGGDALCEAVPLALSGEPGRDQDERARSYHSHPTAEAYDALRANGYRLMRLREMLARGRELR